MKFPHALSLVAVLALAMPFAEAQEFAVTLQPASSSSQIGGTYAVDLDTTVRGNFDAVTNPSGTQTRPGLIGGGGNQPIPVDMTVSGPVNHNGPASGTLTARLDRLAGTFACSELDWDLLGGQTAQSDVTLDLLYSTFRTITPNSTFFGGIPVQIPGGTQTIDQLSAVQSAPALGTLTLQGGPDQYAFQVLVPVEVSLTVTFNGAPTPVGPVPAVLPLMGTLQVQGAQVSMSVQVDQMVQQSVQDPLPGFALMDVPLPVPTVLPAGAVANLLLDGTVDQADLDWTIDLDLIASGTAQPGFSSYCEVNPNSTGLLGTLSLAGSLDVMQGDLTLTAQNLPVNVFGIYLMSPAQGRLALAPPAQGILCMGAPFFRFSDAIYFSGPSGSHSFAVPFGNLPQGQVFQAGSTWNFQAWHRDMNPGPTSNLTQAATVVFLP